MILNHRILAIGLVFVATASSCNIELDERSKSGGADVGANACVLAVESYSNGRATFALSLPAGESVKEYLKRYDSPDQAEGAPKDQTLSNEVKSDNPDAASGVPIPVDEAEPARRAPPTSEKFTSVATAGKKFRVIVLAKSDRIFRCEVQVPPEEFKEPREADPPTERPNQLLKGWNYQGNIMTCEPSRRPNPECIDKRPHDVACALLPEDKTVTVLKKDFVAQCSASGGTITYCSQECRPPEPLCSVRVEPSPIKPAPEGAVVKSFFKKHPKLVGDLHADEQASIKADVLKLASAAGYKVDLSGLWNMDIVKSDASELDLVKSQRLLTTAANTKIKSASDVFITSEGSIEIDDGGKSGESATACLVIANGDVAIDDMSQCFVISGGKISLKQVRQSLALSAKGIEVGQTILPSNASSQSFVFSDVGSYSIVKATFIEILTAASLPVF